jgi:hypothetical protein
MEEKRYGNKDKLWFAKEEVKDLERLLKEANCRLNLEYERSGGRNFWQLIWYFLGFTYE